MIFSEMIALKFPLYSEKRAMRVPVSLNLEYRWKIVKSVYKEYSFLIARQHYQK